MPEEWPELPYAAWKETCATLQLWTQIVGKTRLALTPWLNHSWHVTFDVHRARPRHPIDACGQPWIADRIRLHQSHPLAAREHRTDPAPCTAADERCGVLHRVLVVLVRTWGRCAHRRIAETRLRTPFRFATTPRMPPMIPTSPTGFGGSFSRLTRCFHIFERRSLER